MGSDVRPYKRFGQHFLRDRFLARRIIDSLQIQSGDHVLEIGPGEGVLTEFLVKSSAERIIAVEIDFRLASILKGKFRQQSQFELIEGDFLKIDFNSFLMGQKKLRVVGNLPYSITSPILFNLLDHRASVQDAIVTVQKEVGIRITSPPGSKAYGIPSVLFQLFCQIKALFTIPGSAFYPKPKVDSIVLHITFLPQPRYRIEDEAFFRQLVKVVFGQRRKMLRNSLKGLVKDEKVLKSIPIDLSRRPEALSIEEFVLLSHMLFSE